jgi:uncharacterized cupredoxin-like copper-binding protein
MLQLSTQLSTGTKHRLILVCLLLLSLVITACGGASEQSEPEAAQVAANPGEGSTTVNVTAIDFSYALDKTEASAGTVNFVIENSGAMQHDFAIQVNGVEQKSAMLQPGESTTLSVTLSPGTYSYRCTVPGHEVLGMKGTFVVN